MRKMSYAFRNPLASDDEGDLISAVDGLEVDPDSSGMAIMRIVSLAATGALVYHGYKRNNSVGWAIMWGLFGGITWPIMLPIALAQGFGKRSGR